VAPKHKKSHSIESSGSIPIFFRGHADEIDIGSSLHADIRDARLQAQNTGTFDGITRINHIDTMAENREPSPAPRADSPKPDSPKRGGSDSEPRPNPFRLTRELNDFTPSKAKFDNDMNNQSPGVIPSPLHLQPGSQLRSRDQIPDTSSNVQVGSSHRGSLSTHRLSFPTQQMPSPMIARSPIQFGEMRSDYGGDIVSHFHLTNTHMENLAARLSTLMEKHEGEILESMTTKHNELLATLYKQSEEGKLQMEDMEASLAQMLAEQNDMAADFHQQMRKFKMDCYEAFENHTNRTAALENEVKELKKMVEDLKKLVVPKVAQPRSPTKLSSRYQVVTPNPTVPSMVGEWVDNVNEGTAAARISPSRGGDKKAKGKATDAGVGHQGAYGGAGGNVPQAQGGAATQAYGYGASRTNDDGRALRFPTMTNDGFVENYRRSPTKSDSRPATAGKK